MGSRDLRDVTHRVMLRRAAHRVPGRPLPLRPRGPDRGGGDHAAVPRPPRVVRRGVGPAAGDPHGPRRPVPRDVGRHVGVRRPPRGARHPPHLGGDREADDDGKDWAMVRHVRPGGGGSRPSTTSCSTTTRYGPTSPSTTRKPWRCSLRISSVLKGAYSRSTVSCVVQTRRSP